MDPLPLSTGEPASFGNLTMRIRIPSVIRTVASTNPEFAPDVLAELEKFAHEVETGAPLRALANTAGAEQTEFDAEWQRVLQLHAQAGWLSMPWYEAEAYMYRCLLDITLYHAPGGRDPFASQKEAELSRESTWSLVRTALTVSAASASTFDAKAFSTLLRFCVLGNKADLCYAKVASTLSSSEPGFDESLLLVNDEAAVAQHVESAIECTANQDSEKSLDFAIIVDNSGAELLCDLVLADFLLARSRPAAAVTLTIVCKRHPTFVSDVTPADFYSTVDHLRTAFEESDPCRLLGDRLHAALESNALRIMPHEFFNGPLFFDAMPPDLAGRLESLALVFIKGDANYRRLLLDRRWPVDMAFRTVVARTGLSECKILSLRTCKSDPIVGLARDAAQALDQADPQWRVNGVRGVIQACLPQHI